MLTAIREELIVVISAMDADASAALEVVEFPIDRAITLVDIKAWCDSDNPPTGSAAQIDVNEGGTSILSTKLTIDATEYHTDTAATPAVISDSALAAGSILTFDIDQVGSTNPGRGYGVTLIVLRSI